VAIAAVCLTCHDLLANMLENRSVAATRGWSRNLFRSLGLFYSYPLYVYFNFSGYCDIVIGAGSIVGLRLPENFNRPFLSRNLLEYWTRFHITLGLWIRDYVFIPLCKGLLERWPRRTMSIAVVSYFVAFFLAGLWHGSTWNFVVYGFLNGAGVAAAKLWESILVQWRGRSGLRAYLRSPAVRTVAVAITFHYVCFTLFFFPGNLGQRLRLLGNMLSLALPAMSY
jgi:D-alanyl-lipoteichoic acid acyltransferase DltB (MBOAT superfamily)